VRIGNAAAHQTQLDIYGEVLDAAYLCYTLMPRPLRPEFWAVLRSLADQAAARWRAPDQGIWEVRGGPRHFLYSKLLCWVAPDRAVRLAEHADLAGDVARWRQTREAIRQALLTVGYDEALGRSRKPSACRRSTPARSPSRWWDCFRQSAQRGA
jgi:GH15 family glucan-1,4-alpha-glucosidase